jgi:hypothetical protein
MVPTLEKIESTGLSIAIREGGLPYPIIGGIHLLAIALFGGMVLITNLRFLGWGIERCSVSDLVQQFRPWKWAGFVVVTITGLLLTWSEPVKLYRSPSFWIKMVLFLMLGVHAIVFRRDVYGNTVALDKRLTSRAKLAAATSMILWTGVVVFGRWIALDD